MIAGKPIHSLLITLLALYSYHHVFPVLSFGLDFFSSSLLESLQRLRFLLDLWLPCPVVLGYRSYRNYTTYEEQNNEGAMSQVTPGKAQGTDSQTFLTALITNASVLALEVAAFVLLRSRLWRIYEPRTYLPPPGYASPAALLVRS
jgi:hypothetical protein